MTSLLRQIVAGPRAKHVDSGLDLCYVTSYIIATSGPSQSYPQRAYRNPLDRLVAFLDEQHGRQNWRIWEFRAEGTGYPDEAVRGRIRHFPWPDHHPPPFGMVPGIMESMRGWMDGGEGDGGKEERQEEGGEDDGGKVNTEKKNKRVVLVHCKAGKGRSGTMACSYLIAERGWKAEDALAQFTKRRMRPGFGAGVSTPSQLRWVSYVDRWARLGGKRYVDRPVEVCEIHVWGLRHGARLAVEGFADGGRKIEVVHVFKSEERIVVSSGVPTGKGVVYMMADTTGYRIAMDEIEDVIGEDADDDAIAGGDGAGSPPSTFLGRSGPFWASKLVRKISNRISGASKAPIYTEADALPPRRPRPLSETLAPDAAPGSPAIIFKAHEPVVVATSDVNIVVERRHVGMGGLTMTTSTAHVWFNAFFEGRGPDSESGEPERSGVFELDWDKMDGIKGSSQKGTRAFEKMAVVWTVRGSDPEPRQQEEAEAEAEQM